MRYIGYPFGSFIVIDDDLPTNTHRMLRVRCECGTVKEVRLIDLQNGQIKSCGCYRKRRMAELNKTHGKTGTWIYNLWMNIKDRCIYTNRKEYKLRGVTIYEPWINDFELFETEILKLGPKPKGYSLDRIDNNKDYEPENLRWASPKEQARNRRNNKLYDWNGEKYCQAEMAEIAGISPQLFYSREKRHWTLEEIMTGHKGQK